jgi:hypothetical protein
MSTKIWVLRAFASQIHLHPNGVFIMRKIVSLSLVAGAALLVAACGGTPATAPEANTAAPEVNAADAMEGTTNDATANVDAAAGAEANMTADNAAGNATEAAANAAVDAANAAGEAANAAK